MRTIAAALVFSLSAANAAPAQEAPAETVLAGAQPAAAASPSDYAAILAFDICAEIVANGPTRIGPTIATVPGLRVSSARAVSALPSDIGASAARMLDAEAETIVRTIAPPEAAAADAPFVAVARMDARGCVVITHGVADALGPVFVRAAQPDSGWTHMDERDGAHLYRRAGDLRMILAPRQGDVGADQIIVFRESPAAP